MPKEYFRMLFVASLFLLIFLSRTNSDQQHMKKMLFGGICRGAAALGLTTFISVPVLTEAF